jgi:hypothetical protein
MQTSERKGGLIATDLETGEIVFQDFDVEETLIRDIIRTLQGNFHFEILTTEMVDGLAYGGA